MTERIAVLVARRVLGRVVWLSNTASGGQRFKVKFPSKALRLDLR